MERKKILTETDEQIKLTLERIDKLIEKNKRLPLLF